MLLTASQIDYVNSHLYDDVALNQICTVLQNRTTTTVFFTTVQLL